MLRYTGHPFVDVGAATLTAFAEKERPEHLTSDDLQVAAEYMEKVYMGKHMNSFLVCVFPNSAYVNPTSGADKKQQFLDFHLYGFRQAATPEAPPCVACGQRALGPTFRQHVPLLTGEDVLNFFPNAQPGLPLCGACLLAIAALPLGALKCSGRALILHADDDSITLDFAREHLERNRRLLQLAGQSNSKYPDAKEVRTRLMEQLCAWAERQRRRGSETRALSLTAYHFTNSGQGPDIDIYHLPSQLVDFVRTATGARYASAWNAIVRRAWWAGRDASDAADTRNVFYEDLLRLPDNAPLFIRRYFLREAYRAAPKDDPRGGYNLAAELDVVSWPLTDLFLRKVVNMDRSRIEAIRALGDRLAEYIESQNDRRFWRRLYTADEYYILRNALIKASESEIKAGRPPLITFDDFILVFEEGEELVRTGWGLARDLALIRVIEQLHARQWFAKNPEALSEESDTSESDEEKEAATA